MNKGYIYLIITALSYASMGALVKVLNADLPPMYQTFLRLCFSGLFTLALVFANRQKFALKQRRDYGLVAIMGVFGYGISLVFYTLAIINSTIGNVLFVFSAYPIITSVLAFLFLKEKISQRVVVAYILLALSLFLIFDPTNLSKFWYGNIYALLSSLFFVIYLLFSKVLTKDGNSPEVVTLWTVFFAVVTTGIGAVFFEKLNFSHIDTKTILVLAMFGFLNFLGYNCINRGFKYVSLSVGTMVLLLEPVIGSGIGLIFFKEIPSLLFVIGAVEVILAIYIISFRLDQ